MRSVEIEFVVCCRSSSSRDVRCECGAEGGQYHNPRARIPVSVCITYHVRSTLGESAVSVVQMVDEEEE